MLTAIEVKNAQPGRHTDGGGLYLLVRPSGSRSWVLRAQVDGKRQDFGLGSIAVVSLAQARTKAAMLRAKLKSGEEVHPRVPAPKGAIPDFSEATHACHKAIKSGWRNEHHRASWLASLENHIFPHIGAVQVNEVTSVMVRDALASIWLVIPETARRILQHVRTVLEYSHLEGWCLHEASLRSVPKGLPRQPIEENHFLAMPYMVVPLSPAAVAILRRRWPFRFSDQGLVFSTHGLKPLSDMTMTKVLRDLGLAKITVHGFRSSFTDWAAEQTEIPKEVVYKALAHKLVDRVEAAYRRTDFFERRRLLMNRWATYITGRAVVHLAAA